MNADEILRLIDQITRENKIDREIVFCCIEDAIATAAQRRGAVGEESEYAISIDRQTGEIYASRDGVPVPVTDVVERTGIQTSKQIITQKIRDATRERIYNKYLPRVNELVYAEIRRVDRTGFFCVIDDEVEAFLPFENKIRNENCRINSKIAAVIESVDRETRRGDGKRRDGRRPQITLSRTSPRLVERLFEQECPEISQGQVEIVKCARDPGHRAKIAVRALDPRMTNQETLGAFLGVRSVRCSNVSKEINGERVDVVFWSDNVVELIQNALRPAVVDEVILCKAIDRAIVLVRPDQRQLAIGHHGQNVKLAKKLCEWELEILSNDEEHNELEELLDHATASFMNIEGVTQEVAEALVGEGFVFFEDLACIEPDFFCELTGLSEEKANEIATRAEEIATSIDALRRIDGLDADAIERLAINGVETVDQALALTNEVLVEQFGFEAGAADEILVALRNYKEALNNPIAKKRRSDVGRRM